MKREKLTHDYTPSIKLAHDFAVEAHAGQTRVGTSHHYITHLLNVGEELMHQGATETLLIATLLKDTLTKTNVRLDQIKDQFGLKVSEIVKSISLPINWKEVTSVDIPMIKLAEALDDMNGLDSDRLDEDHLFYTLDRVRGLLSELGPLVQAYALIDEDLSIKDLYEKVEKAVDRYDE